VCVATSLREFDINLRRGPSVFHGIIGTLGPHSSLEINGKNFNGTWYVNVDNGRQAWIAANLVSLNGPCDNLPVIQGPPAPFTPTFTPTATPIVIVITSVVRPPRTRTPFVVTATPIVITATPIVVTSTPTNTPTFTPVP